MTYKSIWNDDNRDIRPQYPALDKDIRIDVAIIGGGITGVSAGYFLAKNGIDAAVFEMDTIGAGTTGSSTGNLYVPVDEMFHKIRDKYDADTVRLVAESRMAGLKAIHEIIDDYSIDCDYRHAAWNLIAETPDALSNLKKEYEAFKEAGVPATMLNSSEILPNALGSLQVPQQAQIDPKKYVQGLASAAKSAGCAIYEGTRVLQIEEQSPNHFILYTSGGIVHASAIIHATHTPKGEKLFSTVLAPYREYVLAAKLNSPFPEGIYWTEQQKHHYSMRTCKDAAGDNYLLCLGEPHKVGQQNDYTKLLSKLERYMRGRFDVGEINYYWGAQHYKAADKLPYIGKNGESSVYIATGFATDGLVYGTTAGRIISDLITEKPNKWVNIYAPDRINALKSAGRFAKENLNVIAEFIKDFPFSREVNNLAEVGVLEGKTIEIGGKQFGASRDANGKLTVVSAICPHLGCIVHWNKSEKSWDCPCHGSRFTPSGKCIEGPALNDLSRMEDI